MLPSVAAKVGDPGNAQPVPEKESRFSPAPSLAQPQPGCACLPGTRSRISHGDSVVVFAGPGECIAHNPSLKPRGALSKSTGTSELSVGASTRREARWREFETAAMVAYARTDSRLHRPRIAPLQLRGAAKLNAKCVSLGTRPCSLVAAAPASRC